jgi:hypothetical protein
MIPRSLALLATLAAVAVASAQAPSGARLRIDKVPTHAIRGLSAADTKAFQSQVQRVVDAVAAQPAIAQPPAPVCALLHPWIEQGVSDEGIAMATLLPAFRPRARAACATAGPTRRSRCGSTG